MGWGEAEFLATEFTNFDDAFPARETQREWTSASLCLRAHVCVCV